MLYHAISCSHWNCPLGQKKTNTQDVHRMPLNMRAPRHSDGLSAPHALLAWVGFALLPLALHRTPCRTLSPDLQTVPGPCTHCFPLTPTTSMPSAPLTAQLDTDTSKNLTLIAQLMVTLLVVQLRQNILRCSQQLLCPSNLGVTISATCLCSAHNMLRREPPHTTPVRPSSCSFLELVLRPCITGQLPQGHLRIRPNCCVRSHVVESAAEMNANVMRHRGPKPWQYIQQSNHQSASSCPDPPTIFLLLGVPPLRLST